MYPIPLVKAILRGIALQSKEGLLTDPKGLCAMPMSYNPKQPRPEFGPPTHSSVPKVSRGKIPVTYDEPNFKERYLDEYTGEMLAPHLIRPAIEDELNYFNSKVWQLSTVEEMEKFPDTYWSDPGGCYATKAIVPNPMFGQGSCHAS